MKSVSFIICCAVIVVNGQNGLIPSCSNSDYDLIVDPSGSCGTYRCACSNTAVCSTGDFYCPCPFPYGDISAALDGSSCQCLLANLCGTTCPIKYWNSGSVCKVYTTTGDFKITLINMDLSTTDYSSYFEEAARRWQSIITADITDNPSLGSESWFADYYYYNEDVDDVAIAYSVGDIDGYGGTLAMAGPLYIRDDKEDSSYGLPISGLMIFDIDDIVSMVADGTFVSVVIHEMGHVLGFGTTWPTSSLCGESCDVYADGATGVCFASNEYAALGLLDELKVESDGVDGDGTYCSHWSEDQLTNELMTGIIDPEFPYSPLSSITIGAMADLGYSVDYSKAEPLEEPVRLRELREKNTKSHSHGGKSKRLRTDVLRPQVRGVSKARSNKAD